MIDGQYDKIDLKTLRELPKFCSTIIESIRTSEKDLNDLENSLLLSYANFRRFNKYLMTYKWVENKSYAIHDIYYLATGADIGLAKVREMHPELYEAYAPESYENIILYPIDQWVNIITWFESSLKHLHYSRNIDSAANFALVTALAGEGLTRMHYYSDKPADIRARKNYLRFKTEINFGKLLRQRNSAEGDDLREECYAGWLNYDSDESTNEMKLFKLVLYIVALGALSRALKIPAELNFKLTQIKLLSDVRYYLTIAIDKCLLGYYSHGNLKNGVHYTMTQGENDSQLFVILDETKFESIISSILPIAEKYENSLCELLIDKI